MFLSIREIRSAGGRFILIGSVTMFITLLIIMLTGLTQGLAARNTSALSSLDADAVVFVDPFSDTPEVSFSNSVATEDAARAVTAAASQVTGRGLDAIVPLGVGQTRLESDQGAQPVAVLGLPDGTEAAGVNVGKQANVSETTATELGLSTGDTIALGGTEVTVGQIVPDEYYSHSPVVWVDTATWQQVSHAEAATTGTVLLAYGDATAQQWDTIAADTHTAITDTKGSFEGLAAYKSERTSLTSMQGFLYGISALVTISFLSVWTLQRTRDIAVLRALGASPRYVLADALTQAAIILAVGTGAGALIGFGLGALVSGTVPFELSWLTIAGPAVAVFVLGIAGALLAVRQTTKVDPMTALGASV